MAKKPTITSITSGYASTNTLNDNFEALRDAFDNTLSLDGSTPNSMTSDLNLNNNDILNASRILVGGVDYIATALSYKNDAETAKTAAEAAQAAAELAYDNFDDRYLGSKASDPTVDNDGNALLDGALYYDTINTVMKFYDTSTSTWYRTTPNTSDQANIDIVAGNTTNINTVAGISGNVTTVAGISSDVTTVAADTTDIGTVATSISNVNTAATNISNINTVSGISANVTTVAGNTTNINTVAGNNSNITTVAGISSDVTTVAGQTTNLQNVTDNLTAIQNAATNATNAANSASAAATSAAAAAASADFFDDVYLGSKASDPATDNDGDALNAGDLYFNTTSNNLKVYSGSAWQDAAVDSSGFVQTTGDTMTGNLTVPNVIVSGNVDGRDVSADGAKLDGIEANADVTDTANVTAAGALMDSELTDIAAVKALNQGVATTDAPTFTNTQLNAISATISDTAVDIFVYDTRKDSDGGAWRKRTQHTSWYNETLNTSTRGSRKEFPAVAVITVDATSDYITIYDGDDPDMPMWMVFNSGGNRLIRYNTSFGGVSVVNGRMVVGNNATIGGFSIIDFVMDYGAHYNSSDTQVRKYDALANRNVSIVDGTVSSPFTTDTSSWLLNKVNNVAMTVLPNAPIDAATGLPVPTIAVATDGGVSVIKDDGTVVDTTSTDVFEGVSFVKSQYGADLYALNTTFADDPQWYPNVGGLSDGFVFTKNFYANTPSYEKLSSDVLSRQSGNVFAPIAEHTFAVGTGTTVGIGLDPSLNLVQHSTTLDRKGVVAYINSSHNTGWMHGDIKLATLSDKYNASEPNVTGSEITTDGTFSDTANWTEGDAAWSVTGGALVGTSVLNNKYTGQSIISISSGTLLTAVITVSSYTAGNLNFSLRDVEGGTNETPVSFGVNGTGTFTATIRTTQANAWLEVLSSGTTTMTIDDISVRLAEEDRSVNNNGLQVFGTVTKSAVASGADLVAYSGFSTATNYLEQPYNSDLDFGTGDFCVMGWQKNTVASKGARDQTFVSRYDGTYGFFVRANYPTGVVNFYTGASGYDLAGSIDVCTDTWNHIVALRRNGVKEIYVNGKFDTSEADSSNQTQNLAVRIGQRQNNSADRTQGSMALWRISATAPSPEQILKIYNDEKVLFQENAQATLYGSSDAVTALAYDDSTNLLHVGTSAGRSVFQGLRRVDNTTTAVGAAISASGGLVADE